jgi:Rieske Fe-S protein
MPDPAAPHIPRRTVMSGAAVAGAGILAAGCSTSEPPPAGATDQPAGTPVGPISEIPVGGGRIFEATGVVVTQPTAGTFNAFSDVCSHQGCTVGSVEDGNIVCPCHGSRFALDGSVVQGPAETGLEPRSITVENGEITLS